MKTKQAPNIGKYCKKHDHWYMNELNTCNFCAGEKIGKGKVMSTEDVLNANKFTKSKDKFPHNATTKNKFRKN